MNTENLNNQIKTLTNWKGCEQCGDDNDLSAFFMPNGLCAKCVRKNYRKAVK